MSEQVKKGGISVETKNIFPVIKKWLYSDKDIFVRELVSNACDAITKHKRLVSLGETASDGAPYRIDVTLDNDLGTLTFSDNGIGMNAEEIDKYINQIALSGAVDFIQKYENSDDKSENNGIIGHFGLGFYSAFMIADTVEIRSKSWHDETAVQWKGSAEGDYEMSETDERDTRGTDIVLHINEDEKEYASAYKIREILDKFCAFMPYEIYFTELPEKEEPETDADESAENGETTEKTEKPAPAPINDTTPLWLKRPQDCTEEEYKSFYQKVFRDYREPLFWIHINADYPLNFKGILYFPRITNEYESLEGQVKLYYNQVFVADNIKEVIPEFLLMLRGVIDCPELPLNVSRSYLQNSGYVAKMSQHIVKKVADKLNSLFNTERESYEKLWQDIKVFVEYGSLREKKFYDRIKGSVIYQLTGGKYVTLDEYLEAAKEKHENTVYYATDKMAQAQYISMLESEGIDIMYLDKGLDAQFISMIEQEKNVKFLRVDAGVADALKGDGEKLESKALADLFVKVSGNEKLKVTFESLKDGTLPAILTVSEQDRRFGEMMKLYGMQNGEMPAPEGELILNSGSDMIKRLSVKAESGDADAEAACAYIYKLALLAQRKLSAEELTDFLKGSFSMLDRLV